MLWSSAICLKVQCAVCSEMLICSPKDGYMKYCSLPASLNQSGYFASDLSLQQGDSTHRAGPR